MSENPRENYEKWAKERGAKAFWDRHDQIRAEDDAAERERERKREQEEAEAEAIEADDYEEESEYRAQNAGRMRDSGLRQWNTSNKI